VQLHRVRARARVGDGERLREREDALLDRACVVGIVGMLVGQQLLAAGEAIAIAPADSPKIVTLAGSPPNWAMFSCTQRRPAI